MTSNEYLYDINSREQIARWASSLRFFRFKRAGGGLLNDGDVLMVRLGFSDSAELEQLLAKLDQPSDISLPSIIKIEGVDVSSVIVPDGLLLMISDDTDPYIVSEAAVAAAQKVEQKLVALTPWLIDPPDISQNCICPQRFPEFWPARYQYSWPLKWQVVLLLLPLAGLMFLLTTFLDEVSTEFMLFFALFGLVILAGTAVGMLKTTITVDTYGDFEIKRSVLGFTLFRQKVVAAKIVRVEVQAIPVKVNPGVRPRNTYAFNLIHRDGNQPIHLGDDITTFETAAKGLADALGLTLEYT
ncbi:MAG: hypothetical protein AB7I41_08490 [Candidatus Sericytochromatia bacterium]